VQKLYSIHPNPNNNQFVFELVCLLNGQRRSAVDFYKLLSQEASQLKGFHQNDAHEALSCILNSLDMRLSQLLPSRVNKEYIKDPLVGQQMNELICLTCHTSKQNKTEFSAITLPLSMTNSSAQSINAMLNQHFKPEIISDVRCECCSLLAVRNKYAQQLKEVVAAHSEGSNEDKIKRLINMIKVLESRITYLNPEIPLHTPHNLIVPRSESLSVPLLQKREFINQTIPVQLPECLTLHVNRLLGEYRLSTPVFFEQKLDLSVIQSAIRYQQLRSKRVHEAMNQTQEQRGEQKDEDIYNMNNERTSSADEANSEVKQNEDNEKRNQWDLKQIESSRKIIDNPQLDQKGKFDEVRFNPPQKSYFSIDAIYDLKSVLCHTGRSTSGHYTAYRKQKILSDQCDFNGQKMIREQWWFISDADITAVDWKTVQSNASKAYLLFYQRL